MPTVRGKSAVKQHIADTKPALLKVLRGAGRAAAKVVADEAKARSVSPEVSAGIVTKTKAEGEQVTVKVTVKPGWPRSLGTWLEYGTDPHIISVADDQDRQGMTINRINKVQKAGTLVIGGQPVGKVVEHPGARAHPFLRVSLDTKEREAIGAAQSYLAAHVKPSGVMSTTEPEGDAE